MIRTTITITIIALSLTSCASITSGTHQTVSVKTGGVGGASCALENNKGKWYVSTPGSVTVDRSYNALVINCQKSGLPSGHKVVESHTKGLVMGNAIIGGMIGVGIDAASGAAYDYPYDIDVPMRRA